MKNIEKDLVVEEVYQHLKIVFHKHVVKAMLEVGQYIIKSFYDNNYKQAQGKEFNGKKSLLKLIKRLQSDSQGDVPSRTWVYDAVNLAIDQYLFEEKKLPSVYGQLGHSHKVNLTYVNKLEIKKQLIQETFDESYTVSQLRKRMREEKVKTGIKYVSLKSNMPVSKLKALDVKKIRTLKKQTLKLEKELKKRLNIYQSNLKKLKKILETKQK